MSLFIFIPLGIVLVAVLVVGVQILRTLNKGKDKKQNEDKVMEQKFDTLFSRVFDELKEGRQSTQKTSLAMHGQIQNFTQGVTKLQENMQGISESVKESMKNVTSLQDIFKSPKLRGQWGEMSLESALSSYFIKDAYDTQYYFKSGEAVDAILRLPNGLLLPIDSKFNLDNLQRMLEAENDSLKDQYRKVFLADVKGKVDEIASKYILPSEGTTDFAIMYIPAEAIYYELIHNVKDVNLHKYALNKKVILTSPNTLYANLSALQQWFKDVHISNKTKEIIEGINWVKKDAEKLDDSFRKLGKHLSDTQSAFDSSEKRLSLMGKRMNRVTNYGEKEVDSEEVVVSEDKVAPMIEDVGISTENIGEKV